SCHFCSRAACFCPPWGGRPPMCSGAAPAVLEDAAALARYRHQWGGRDEEAVLSLPPAERYASLAVLRAEQLTIDLRRNGKCGRCMLQAPHCICGRLGELRAAAAAGLAGRLVHFVVWMCVQERRRASNTGKLLEHVLPGSEVLVQGLPADARRLESLLAAAGERAFVLFPSPEASPASELRPAAAAHSACGSPGGAEARPFLAVLVDGTWRQAQHMVHRSALAAVRPVALSPRGHSQFHWRRQTQEGRISTVEAAALLLEELGLPPGGAPALLRRALAELNGALEPTG
ncbi:unnamed protein product, partial [Prorocentrum cordatum]